MFGFFGFFENRYVGRTFQHLGARIRQHVPLNLVPVAARGSRPRRGRPPKCPVQSVSEVDLSKSAVNTLADPSSFFVGRRACCCCLFVCLYLF